MERVVIVDYGAGNLHSVAKAVERSGVSPVVTADPAAIHAAAALIVPGVGAAADTMRNLRASGVVEPIRRYIADGRPFLGVCMGMQTLFTYSEEGGHQECLDIIPGVVRRIQGELKVPHMGWNTVHQLREHPIFDGIPENAYFYFVHGFYAEPEDRAVVVGETEYGAALPAVVARDNVVATQFHPEKSSTHGLRLYANFLRAALKES